jgi:EmrB/QacA subfamily drug resistance transporter
VSEPAAHVDWATALPRGRKMVILSAALLCLFLAALDQTIVATALPAIVAQFHGIDLLAWVSIGYVLASTAMIPFYGRLSDLRGRRFVLLTGVSIFLAGSVLCGLATGMWSLIFYRVIQGIGSAAIVSTAFAVPADLFPPSERARYTGLFGATFGLASVIGPFVGGLLTDHFNWRWIFYVNLPLGGVALAFIASRMPSLRNEGERHPLDAWGTVLLIAAVVPLLIGLSLDPHTSLRGIPLEPVLLTLAVFATAAFMIVERRAAAPIIPLDLFRNRTFASVCAASVFFGAAFFAAILFLSLFMVNVVGVSATDAGTAIIPLTFGVVFGGIIASWITHRTHRYKGLIVGGLALMAVGFWLASQMNVETTRFGVMWRMVVLGLGGGPGMPLMNLASQNAVPQNKAGTVTASRQFFALIGQALGGAVFGMILSTTLTATIEARLVPVIAELPSAVRASFDPAQFRNSASGHSGGASAPASIAERVAAGIRADYAARRAGLGEGELAPLAREEALALKRGDDTARRMTQAIRESFAIAVTRVYFVGIFIVLVALAIVAFTLPELPLRTSNAPEPAMTREPGEWPLRGRDLEG